MQIPLSFAYSVLTDHGRYGIELDVEYAQRFFGSFNHDLQQYRLGYLNKLAEEFNLNSPHNSWA